MNNSFTNKSKTGFFLCTQQLYNGMANRVFEFNLTVDIEERCAVMATICLLVIGFSPCGVKLLNIMHSAFTLAWQILLPFWLKAVQCARTWNSMTTWIEALFDWHPPNAPKGKRCYLVNTEHSIDSCSGTASSGFRVWK